MYSLLEQHTDGSWWYHPGCSFDCGPEGCQVFLRLIRMTESFEFFKGESVSRSFKILNHSKPFPQDMSRCTRDFVNFNFAGGYEFNIKEGEK